MVSSPCDYEALDVERERGNLERALSGLTEDGSVELHWLERPSLGGLLRKLQDDTFHGMHYPADTSVASARLAMLADRSDDIEWGTPVLFMRVTDGRLFDLGERPARAPAQIESRIKEPPSVPEEREEQKHPKPRARSGRSGLIVIDKNERSRAA